MSELQKIVEKINELATIVPITYPSLEFVLRDYFTVKYREPRTHIEIESRKNDEWADGDEDYEVNIYLVKTNSLTGEEVKRKLIAKFIARFRRWYEGYFLDELVLEDT